MLEHRATAHMHSMQGALVAWRPSYHSDWALQTLYIFKENGSQSGADSPRSLKRAGSLNQIVTITSVYGVCVCVHVVCACMWCVHPCMRCVSLAHEHLTNCGGVTCLTGLLLYSKIQH